MSHEMIADLTLRLDAAISDIAEIQEEVSSLKRRVSDDEAKRGSLSIQIDSVCTRLDGVSRHLRALTETVAGVVEP